MKIVVISDWFTEKMGYSENCLPKALAALGPEVHVVTSDAQIYFDSPYYKDTYEPFIGPPLAECGIKRLDGYTLHRLPHGRSTNRLWRNRLRIQSLVRKLAELEPDIVQTFDVACPTTYEAALGKVWLRYDLFLEAHTHASVWSPRPRSASLTARMREGAVAAANRLVSAACVKCYPISTDAAEIAVRFGGIDPMKIDICPLGVDTALFTPAADPASQEQRRRLRFELGFSDREVVCVYTGRFTEDKGPCYLAQAIERLVSEGAPVRGLFVGCGAERDVAAIRASAGCVVHPFVPVCDLPRFYRAADVGVWPKQESTSQLDAAACGLPLVLSDRIQVRERVDGNGLTYLEGDPADLAAKIRTLIDPERRRRMGALGAAKVRRQFAWDLVAKRRLADYLAARRSLRDHRPSIAGAVH